jgi:hypothetical protein
VVSGLFWANDPETVESATVNTTKRETIFLMIGTPESD